MAFGDTASSQGYSAAAGAESGAPLYNSAGIYFGSASIGAAGLTNTPTITPNSSANPQAAQASPGTSQAQATGAPPIAAAVSSKLLPELFLVAGVLAAAVALVIVIQHHKKT